MLETKAYKLIEKWIGKELLLKRIELYTFPDFFFRTHDNDGWIEVKMIRRPKNLVHIPFRSGQFAWINKYVKKDGWVLLFVFVEGKELFVVQNKEIETNYSISSFVEHARLTINLTDPNIAAKVSDLFFPF